MMRCILSSPRGFGSRLGQVETPLLSEVRIVGIVGLGGLYFSGW